MELNTELKTKKKKKLEIKSLNEKKISRIEFKGLFNESMERIFNTFKKIEIKEMLSIEDEEIEKLLNNFKLSFDKEKSNIINNIDNQKEELTKNYFKSKNLLNNKLKFYRFKKYWRKNI